MSGSLDKSFEGAPKIVREGTADQGHSRTKVSSMFVGTQDKCVGCNKTVYPIEKGDVDGTSYHPPYFKCSHGGCVISPSNYVANDHKIYCRHHHTQLFMEKRKLQPIGYIDKSKVVNGNINGIAGSV